MPSRQIGKPEISDSDTAKMFDAVPKSFKHAANLAINSLSQHNPQVRRRDGVQSHDFGSLTV